MKPAHSKLPSALLIEWDAEKKCKKHSAIFLFFQKEAWAGKITQYFVAWSKLETADTTFVEKDFKLKRQKADKSMVEVWETMTPSRAA